MFIKRTTTSVVEKERVKNLTFDSTYYNLRYK
jgi:hypothetical protein